MNNSTFVLNIILKITSVSLLAILVAACSFGGKTKSSQYYVLDAKVEKSDSDKLSNIALGVGPISIPGYIDRPQIVTKTDTPKIQIQECARWAEPMDEMFTRALTQNIQILTKSQQIYSHPWSNASEFKYRLQAKVIKFENNLDGDALLIVHWALIGDTNSSEAMVKNTRYDVLSKGTDVSSNVNALNEAVAQFANDIVKTLEQYPH